MPFKCYLNLAVSGGHKHPLVGVDELNDFSCHLSLLSCFIWLVLRACTCGAE